MDCYQKERSGAQREPRTARRPHLTLRDSEKKEIMLIDMAFPKIRKAACFELRE